MPEKKPCIKQLSPDKRHRRIDWVGGVSKFDDSDSLKIAVYISPALSDLTGYGPSISSSKVAWQKRQRVWIDLCWLPFLEIGSFWKDGYDQKPVTVKPANTNLYPQTPHQTIKLKDLRPMALIEGEMKSSFFMKIFLKVLSKMKLVNHV